jgi:hypothetical protein
LTTLNTRVSFPVRPLERLKGVRTPNCAKAVVIPVLAPLRKISPLLSDAHEPEILCTPGIERCNV